jgi:tetratricopeptide (TPR) repeat protein
MVAQSHAGAGERSQGVRVAKPRAARPVRVLAMMVLGVALGSLRVGVSAQDDDLMEAPPASADELTPLQRAHAHFLLGLDFFRGRDFRKALAEFESAARISPTADLWFNIGRAHEELGQYAQAAGAFSRYLRDRVDAPDAIAVKARIAKLNARVRAARAHQSGGQELGSLRIRGASAQSLVFLDGQPISASGPDAAPLLIAVGPHRFDVTAAGFMPLHATVDVQPGLLTTAYAGLYPTSVARTQAPEHGLDYALFGVAGASAIVSAAFATLSVVQRSEGSIDDARAWAVRADVGLAGTALCALAGGLLYIATQRGVRTVLSPAAARSR